MSEKAVGYLLLATGVGMMCISTFLVFQVFTGRGQPFPVFHVSSMAVDFNQIIGGLLPQEVVSQAAKRPAQKTEILPADTMNQLFNLLTTLMLYGFLINVGAKLASLGVQLVRPINVTLRGEVRSDL